MKTRTSDPCFGQRKKEEKRKRKEKTRAKLGSNTNDVVDACWFLLESAERKRRANENRDYAPLGYLLSLSTTIFMLHIHFYIHCTCWQEKNIST